MRMKQLIVVRHAKSDWGNEGLKDIDRPLNERGYTDAYALSEWFFENHDVPKLFISSDATRALSTAFIFARNLNYETTQVKIIPQIYESNVATLKSVIASIDDSCGSVFLFGHNPGITTLVNELNNELFFDNIPTCGIVSIEFNTNSWKDVSASNGKIGFQKFPKEFKS